MPTARTSLADAPVRRRIHPLRVALYERRIPLSALADATGYSGSTLRNVIAGTTASWPRLRATVAGELGLPEAELFPDAEQ